MQAAPPLAAEAADGAQQTEPQAAGGNTKKEKERQRKERQRQRKMDEATDALQRAIEAMAQTAEGVGAVEEATAEAAKYASRSEPLAALVAEARELIEQARAAEAKRARLALEAAAEEAAAVELAAAAARLLLEEEVAALTLGMQRDALRLQEAQAQLGSSSVVPPAAPQDAETMCVVCLDAPKDHIIVPCGHQCVCEACAEKLKKASSPLCPFCRTPINSTIKVFLV